MTVTIKQHTAKDILDHMKARLAITQSNYLVSPTAFNWNLCLREMFAYQQMHSTVYGPAFNDERERIVERINNPNDFDESWGDTVCRIKLGMNLSDSLTEYGHYTW